MALTTSLTIIESAGGVALAETDQPEDLVISEIVGEDKLNITFSKNAPSGTPTDTVVIRYQASDLVSLNNGQGWFVDIGWGDGATDRFPVAWAIDSEFQHTYTLTGAKTITASLNFRFIDITIEDSVTFTPILNGDFVVGQIQIEKYEDNIRIFEPDWLPLSRIDSTFVDDRVNRAFSYRYRYRLRSLDSEGQPLVTSRFSNILEQPSWT